MPEIISGPTALSSKEFHLIQARSMMIFISIRLVGLGVSLVQVLTGIQSKMAVIFTGEMIIGNYRCMTLLAKGSFDLLFEAFP